jgi:hypothetical protein
MDVLGGAAQPVILSFVIPLVGIIVPGIVLLALSSPWRARGHATIIPLAAARAATIATPPGPAFLNRTGGSADLDWACHRLHESDIFAGLTNDDLRLVASLGERRPVAPGEHLAQAGGVGEHLFLLLSGEFRFLTHGSEEIPVRMAHPGEVVPLAAIIDPPVLVTTLEVITAGEVFAIPRGPLLDLFEDQPAIGFQVYRAAARSFEGRYRKSLDGLVSALHAAMHPHEIPGGSGSSVRGGSGFQPDAGRRGGPTADVPAPEPEPAD